ncbi:uncharacterized protein MKZ38_003687 [Zalerion maritima]|uniref:Uncharacterized protein n=1 Tax=Zalerion maritima TaxID=339359 RepID=A0AAD5RNF2_9PEZI|nr:uncharacterized protein MKZ38_003687 [Zalerion maritima]
MAWVPRGGANFSVLEDEHCCDSPTSPLTPISNRRGHGLEHRSSTSINTNFGRNYIYDSRSNNPFAALRDVDPNNNARSNTSVRGSYGSSTARDAEELAEELRKFHIADQSETDEEEEQEEESHLHSNTDSSNSHSSASFSDGVDENTSSLRNSAYSNVRTPKSKGRGIRARPAIEANTFHAQETIQEEDENIDPASPFSPVTPNTVETVKVTNGKQLLYETFSGKFTRSQQIRRVLDHKFDLFVRLPVDDNSGRTVCYGCNILPRSQKNIERDTYSVIGRPIEDPKIYLEEPNSPLTGKAPKTPFGDPSPRRPERMVSRIEDSLEAIDQLEEQLESFGQVTNIDRVVSPEVKPPAPASNRRLGGTVQSPGVTKKSTSASNTSGKIAAKSTPGSSRFNTLNPSSLREASKRVSLHFGADDQKPKVVVRRVSLARINSLSEPKHKPPRILHPSDDSPASNVVGKARDEGDSRDKKATEKGGRTTGGLGRVKSTKPLTRPNFELPGDAISRRKREEREAKLKAQEEEEKRRREFKARPVRTSSVRTSSVRTSNIHTYPRETIASRARHASKAGAPDNGQLQTPSETTPNKRLSVATRTPLSNGTSSSLSPRGRSSMAGSSPTIQTSRATSTSTGSINGKPSNISAEDQQHQKMRGKEVYARDHKYAEDRERERREREHAARIARQDAAERSRQAGREWAEKQRQKRLASSTTAATPAARVVVS